MGAKEPYETTKFDKQVGVHRIFLEKLVLSQIYCHRDVTAIFSKNDVIFAITSSTVQILYIDLLFDTES